MMKKTFTLEHILYWLAAGLAFLFRFSQLGSYSLLEAEAKWGLSALAISRGQTAELGAHPLYVIVTSLLFRFFGSSDSIARVVPALAGLGLIWLAYLLRAKLGRGVALVLAFGFAIDPLLVAASRTVASPILAIFLLGLTVVAWDRKLKPLAGVLFGLALLAGPAVWLGLLFAGLTLVFAQLLNKQPFNFDRAEILRVGLFTFGTLLLAGTYFLRLPSGISSLGAGMVAFFGQWLSSSGVSILDMGKALLTYQPLALVLALIALVRAYKHPEIRMNAMWFGITLLVLLSYGGRTALDLVWLLLPIWALAANEIARHITYFEINDSVMWSVTGLTALFMTFIWLDLAGLNGSFLSPDDLRIRLWIAAVVVLLIFVSVVLIGIGWSMRSAISGLLWGFVIVFGVYIFSTAWTATRVDRRMVAELWLPSPAIPVSNVFTDWMEELSELYIGHQNGIDIVVLVDSDALAWALRDFSDIKYANQLALGEEPAVVIVYENDESIALQDIYRGQSFNWQTVPLNVGFDPVSFFKWLVERDVTTEAERMIMWVRQDVFADGIFFNQ